MNNVEVIPNFLKLLKLKGFEDLNKLSVDEYDIIYKLMKDCFYSSICYWCTQQGWEYDALETFIDDRIKYITEGNLKDKIKVYIKEPNMPEYIVLWDNFNSDTCFKWIIDNRSLDFSRKDVKHYITDDKDVVIVNIDENYDKHIISFNKYL